MPRPPAAPLQKLVTLDEHLLLALELWRREQTPAQSEDEAIRQVLVEHLKERGFMPKAYE